MLRPLTMFCCGCAPSTGVYLVTACHFAMCLGQLASACASIIWQTTVLFERDSRAFEVFMAGFNLVGLLVIGSAVYGMIRRIEITLRCYLYYLFACFVIDTALLVYCCLWEDVCEFQAFTDAEGGDAGESFMCGIARIGAYVCVSVIIAVEVYILFLVWSVAERLRIAEDASELSQLLYGKDDAIKKNRRPQENPYAGIVGFAHAKVPGPYPSTEEHLYGSTMGMLGQQAIYGGARYDTSHPIGTPVVVL